MRRSTIVAALALALALALATTLPARADVGEACHRPDSPEHQVDICTVAINSGEWQGRDLAWAYYNRANGYAALGQYDLAIRDYDHALKLDPTDDWTHLNRGNAYNNLGDAEAAIRDWEIAIERQGTALVIEFQTYHRARGHYSGPITGQYTTSTRRALRACARDPEC